MSKHTPGPWFYKDDGDGDCSVWSHPKGYPGELILEYTAHVKPVDRANARLIAAAPELAKALRDLDEWQGRQSCNASVYEIDDDEFGVMQAIIHTALKALDFDPDK